MAATAPRPCMGAAVARAGVVLGVDMAIAAPRPCMGRVGSASAAFIESSAVAFDAAFEE